MKNIKSIITEMRSVVTSLSVELTKQYVAEWKGGAEVKVPAGVCVKIAADSEGYKKGEVGFTYGHDSRVVVTGRVGGAGAKFEPVTSKEAITKAVKSLNDRRVTTVLRNMAGYVHNTFGDATWDYKANKPLAKTAKTAAKE